MQKIVPHLWFDTQAKEAAEFYCSVFPNSKIVSSTVIPNTPSGDCDFLTFNLNGHDFMAISAGPGFTINPSISFMVNFDPSRDDKARENLRTLWDSLMEGGTALMELQEYSFSKLYGWVQDKFGVSWQLTLSDEDGEPRPFIVPSLLFAGANAGRAEEALNYYVSVFNDAKIGTLARYPEDSGPSKKGDLMYGDVVLENQWFAAMDSGVDRPEVFSPAVSLLINCDTQEEIDHYWQMSAVPQAEQCGWIADKFGVSWQVSATALNEMMTESTPEQLARVTETFLKMKKFDLATLEKAYRGE